MSGGLWCVCVSVCVGACVCAILHQVSQRWPAVQHHHNLGQRGRRREGLRLIDTLMWPFTVRHKRTETCCQEFTSKQVVLSERHAEREIIAPSPSE